MFDSHSETNRKDCNYQRILVARGGAIGDFILTLPVFAALRTRYPGATIEVLGYPHIATLSILGGLAEAVHPIESPAMTQMFIDHGRIPENVVRLFARFDLIISYLYDPEQTFEHNVRRISAAKYLSGPHRPDENTDRHATEAFLEPLRSLGIVSPDPVPKLNIPSPPNASKARPNVEIVAAHPGSGSEQKNWPENSWALLFDQLVLRTNWRLLLVGGEAETQRLQRLAQHWPADRLEIAYNRPLSELASKLRSCSAFIGHDSGISHLAAAIGLPTLVLWGPTKQSVWRPLGDHVRILSGPVGLESVDVQSVLKECIGMLLG